MADTSNNVVELEFDPVGTNPKNWVPDEHHTVTPLTDDTWRFFKPKLGPFFIHDLVVKHRLSNGTWEELIEGTHFSAGFRLTLGTRLLLRPLYSVIQIIDESLSGEFSVSYHSVGDSPSIAVQQLKIEGAKALLEPKLYSLEDIIDAPITFPPIDHDVLTDDIYRWDTVVESIRSLTLAIAGDPLVPHNHSLEDIDGLVEILKGKASLNNSHKVSVHNAQRISNHTGTVSLTLPKLKNAGAVSGNITMFSGDNALTFARFSGGVDASEDVSSADVPWEWGKVEITGDPLIEDVSFTYDSLKRPVIYLGKDVTFTDVTFVLTDVTFSSDFTSYLREGFSFTKEPKLRGDVKEAVIINKENNALTWAAHQVALGNATSVNKSDKSFTLTLPEIQESSWVTVTIESMCASGAEITVRGYLDKSKGKWSSVSAVSDQPTHIKNIQTRFDNGHFVIDYDNKLATENSVVVIKSATFGTDKVPARRLRYFITKENKDVSGSVIQVRQPVWRDYSVIGNTIKNVNPEPNTRVVVSTEDVNVVLKRLAFALPQHGDTVTIDNLNRRSLLHPTLITGEVEETHVFDSVGSVTYSYDAESKLYKLITGR